MKAPLLNLKSGKVDKAVESFKSILMAEKSGSTSSLSLGVPRHPLRLCLEKLAP